jgi:hypothetical protein
MRYINTSQVFCLISFRRTHCGEISELDHSRPDNIDLQNPKLCIFCLAVSANYNLIGRVVNGSGFCILKID